MQRLLSGCLPETKVNWDLPDQRGTFSQMLHHTWGNTAYETSWAKEPFNSTYQQGDTALVKCSNRASRVLEKGEVPWALAGGLTLFFAGRVLNSLSLSQPIICVQLILPSIPTATPPTFPSISNSSSSSCPGSPLVIHPQFTILVGTTNKG